MNETTVDNLVRRLERLEREDRRLKLAGALVLLGIAAMVVMGQTRAREAAKVIEAERFLLRDISGNIRAELGTLHDGPALVLFDEGLIPRAVLGVIKGLPRLDIHDVKGKRRAVLGETPDGSPRLELYSAKGQRRARLGIQADTANLGLYDQTGRPRLGLNVLAHGEPILIFIDKNEKIQASLDLLPDGTAGLTINDKDGRASLWLGARLEGLGLTIFDKDGTSRAVLGSTSLEAIGTGAITERPESSLVLFNREGRVIWSTP